MRRPHSLSTRNAVLLFSICLTLQISCKSYKDQEAALPDNFYRGNINVSADESFKPVIDEMVQVYESQHSQAKINVQYKPEAECLQDMLTDSVRMLITTRMFNEQERQLMVDSMK